MARLSMHNRRRSGTVHADAHLLRRAVSNLVSNAIRYTTRGNTIVLRMWLIKMVCTYRFPTLAQVLSRKICHACSTVFTDRTNQDRAFLHQPD